MRRNEGKEGHRTSIDVGLEIDEERHHLADLELRVSFLGLASGLLTEQQERTKELALGLPLRREQQRQRSARVGWLIQESSRSRTIEINWLASVQSDANTNMTCHDGGA